MDQALGELVSTLDHNDTALIRCNVGDLTYSCFLNRLKDELRDQRFKDIERYRHELAEYEPVGLFDDGPRKIKTRLRVTENIPKVQYGSWLEDSETRISRSFLGLPISISDSHVFAYGEILKFLLEHDEKVTIVRFDTHCDCYVDPETMDMDQEVNNGNYVVRLLMHDTHEKIARVITVAAQMLDMSLAIRGQSSEIQLVRKYLINGTEHLTCQIDMMPVIDGPVYLDIDLDGHEELNRGVTGGYISARRTAFSYDEYDNQCCIKITPTSVVNILREKVQDPRAISVALERAYRNRIFVYKIETDFLTALAA